MSTGLVQDQTLWSDPIRTNQRKCWGGLGPVFKDSGNADSGRHSEKSLQTLIGHRVMKKMHLKII